MRAVLQRVSGASVAVDGSVAGAIDDGLLVLVGFGRDDSEDVLEKMAQKIIRLRVFSDENDKINLSVKDIGGGLLVVSQFTLYWSCRKGTRPSFDGAMEPGRAEELYNKFTEILKDSGLKVETGIFGADMKVSLINDGPVTVALEL
ncbi:MAG TPA: D-tyrosyl-tRNA(Tyr) deacylase [Candidatus Ornithomonoglobus intestinigallinarum]|uniref:D-aminoacyl-tRNA deacylase n=1 Tax=Candidatus Ornithomonoglobus intestinigallinarum TaxID=2840894 RepID=A0A9D1KQT9_9FIRM|nr:D-tyrosyl-tRNA(Tyr) deacylase [Candidatus Ornithomonoglobus intestinigallinarum]